MAAFSADLSQLEQLYQKYGSRLFALCYLHTGQPGEAFALARTALCDLRYSRKQWRTASAGELGFLQAAHATCMDRYLKNPRGRKARTFWSWGKKASPGQKTPGAALPFSLTDPLRKILRLPPRYKTLLYLRLALGLSPEESAQVMNVSPKRVSAWQAAALKKLDMPEHAAKTCLSSIAAGEDALLRTWEKFITDQDDKGFAGTQRLRRFKRWLDNAIPYIALGVVCLGVFAFFSVERGWFTGAPYEPTEPIEGVTVSGYYGNSPAPGEEDPAKTGTVSVFVPEKDAYTEYLVANCPLSPSAVTRQMVALGGAPEGTSLLSFSTEYFAESSDGAGLMVELSEDAADYFAENPGNWPENWRLLRAMVATYNSLYDGKLQNISIQSGKGELKVGGFSAQSLLFEEGLVRSRVVETEYRE